MQELHAAMPTMDYQYLHAISGDCAAGGLVDQSQVIPIPNDKIAQMILRKYLRNQLEQDLCQDWDEFCELREQFPHVHRGVEQQWVAARGPDVVRREDR